MWLPIVTHSEPLMTPIFLTDKMVKNRSLSARSFQFLFIVVGLPQVGNKTTNLSDCCGNSG